MIAPAAAAARINLAEARIMLAEPSLPSMNILTQIFSGFGAHNLVRVTSGEKAMKLAKGAPLDLIICEATLPDTDGYDFVRQLRRARLEPNSFAPVILVSGHMPRAEVAKARDCGASFVVLKPLSPRVMLERVLWIARESRSFVECDGYVGPDRRFHALGPQADSPGRRKDDAPADNVPAAEASSR